ncbi:hypothetical protein NQ315_012894 [Exocentrus adspersus]|uniref:Uncharacterized protein n=1 Tax=Exocentrus adspersus TaxID=1586481 RepID=A0AAV8VFX1_9CUCU|nr:hypothetical protein NQ315_012894 [Exocentrus adspersus]
MRIGSGVVIRRLKVLVKIVSWRISTVIYPGIKVHHLWSKYSMLRSTINLREGIDISKFPSVILFRKRKGEGYKSKKSLILTREHIVTESLLPLRFHLCKCPGIGATGIILDCSI